MTKVGMSTLRPEADMDAPAQKQKRAGESPLRPSSRRSGDDYHPDGLPLFCSSSHAFSGAK